MDSIFDEVINRENSGSAKYDQREMIFGSEKVIPFWIADMDFKAPKPVIERLKSRIDHGIFGYPVMPDNYFDPIVNWTKKRYGWNVQKDWIRFSPGVVPALAFATHIFTRPGDGIIVQPPVYFPFFRTIESQNRLKIENPLLLIEDRYVMNFEDLESKVQRGAKMIFISNPHNPGGRVWLKNELEQLASICLENNIIIVSDEIHSDIIYTGHHHIPIASLNRKIAMNTITCMAPSKTFNLAGLASSFVIIPDEEKRSLFEKTLSDYHLHHGNIFGLEALKAAYETGEPWLNLLLEYLESNYQYLENFIKTKIPQIKVIKPEGTCLAWLDFSRLNMNRKQLNDFLIHKAEIGLSDGELFGTGGKGFQRLNFACPKSMLKMGLNKLYSAIYELVS